MNNHEIDKVAFELPPDRGYSVKASYLKPPNDGDALIEIFKDGQPLRDFLFPAYKIWNIAAHFRDIVDGEIAKSGHGYGLAAWNGIGPVPNIELPPVQHSEKGGLMSVGLEYVLDQQIRQLRARNAELEKDKARLDWLEKEKPILNRLSIRDKMNSDYWHLCWGSWPHTRHFGGEETSRFDVRQAIDAAMERNHEPTC